MLNEMIKSREAQTEQLTAQIIRACTQLTGQASELKSEMETGQPSTFNPVTFARLASDITAKFAALEVSRSIVAELNDHTDADNTDTDAADNTDTDTDTDASLIECEGCHEHFKWEEILGDYCFDCRNAEKSEYVENGRLKTNAVREALKAEFADAKQIKIAYNNQITIVHYADRGSNVAIEEIRQRIQGVLGHDTALVWRSLKHARRQFTTMHFELTSAPVIHEEM